MQHHLDTIGAALYAEKIVDAVAFVGRQMKLGCKFDKPYEAKCFVEMVKDQLPGVEAEIGDDGCVYVIKPEGKGQELLPILNRFAGHRRALERISNLVADWTREAKESPQFATGHLQAAFVFLEKDTRDFCVELAKVRLPGAKITMSQTNDGNFLIEIEKTPVIGEALAKFLIENEPATHLPPPAAQ